MVVLFYIPFTPTHLKPKKNAPTHPHTQQYYKASNDTTNDTDEDNPAPAFYSSRNTLPAAVANFAMVSLGSIVAGVAMALSCCYMYV